MLEKIMKISTAIILFLSVHLTTAQLNFEGNPLTEHTEYLAEESQLSERSSRQKSPEKSISDFRGTNQVTLKETYQPGTPQKLYPVYNKDPGHEVLQVNSLIKTAQNSESIQNSKLVQSSKPIQNAEPVQVVKLVHVMEPEKKPRQLQDDFINTNALQQEQTHQQQTINPADLALQIFMNSKTPKESEAALSYYLQGGQGLAEQLEFQKQQQIKEKEFQQAKQLRQQQIQQEQMIQKQQQQQRKQEQLFQQAQQEHLQQQLIQQQRAQQLKQLEQEHLNQDQYFRQQVQQQNLQSQIQQNQFQNSQPNQFQNQQIYPQIQQQVQHQQPIVDPLPQNVPQVSGPYPYPAPRIPFVQPRNEFPPGPPIYRRPMRRTNYRQPVPLQPRIGPGIYKGHPPPPTYQGKMIKPPVEVIYSRPPTYARGAPIINSSPVHYEDASPWFPESDHQPPPKDVYYSQLYAQSYDPHYYNYIAKTGKIKPHLYGKLNGEEKKDDGILAELFRGFAQHGIKNIMNPTFLLGMTIPALTFMLTALVQKRSLARSDSRSFDEDEIREYLERLQKALECYRNSKVPTDDRCWR